MTFTDSLVDGQLSRLKVCTDHLEASLGFSDRVMSQILSISKTNWYQITSRYVWHILPIAAVAAAVTLCLAIESERYSDSLIIASADGLEVEW